MIRVGVLGGSFNPAHAGHREMSLLAMKTLKLHFVWWLVTPQNPLKSAQGLKPLHERMAQAQKLANHPRLKVRDDERVFNTTYTFETVRKLSERHQNIQFIWLMGADNLSQFHKWKKWKNIAAHIPICVIDRPKATPHCFASPASLTLKDRRVSPQKLMRSQLPAWCFLFGLKNPLSSTMLRALPQTNASLTRL